MATPGNFLRFNTHWSAPLVSAFARFGGPRKMSQSPVSRNPKIERNMDRPRAVVGVIRGVTVDVSCLLLAGSGIYGVRYGATSGQSAISRCLSALLGRLGRVEFCPRRPRVEKNKPAPLSHLYDHCLETQHP